MNTLDTLEIIFKYCIDSPVRGSDGRVSNRYNLKSFKNISETSKNWNLLLKKFCSKWLLNGTITFHLFDFNRSYITLEMIRDVEIAYEKIKAVKNNKTRKLTIDSKKEPLWIIKHLYLIANIVGWKFRIKSSDPKQPRKKWVVETDCKCFYYRTCPHKRNLPHIKIYVKISKLS